MPLNIVAMVKQVLDPEVPVSAYRIDRQKKRVEIDPTKKIAPVINGFDETAVEAALRIREAGHDVKITVLSAGASFVTDVMKKALSMGSDEMVLVQDPALEGVSDSTVTARVLAGAIKKLGPFDLIIAGRQASDWDNAQVPLGLAELLGVPCIPVTRKVEIQNGDVVCERVIPNGYEVVSAPLPAVVTVSNELGQPRYPTMRNIMAAARKKPQTWTLADLGITDLATKLTMLDLFIPEKQSKCEIIQGDDNNPVDAARKLALRLRETKLV
ncbi:MAG: electron transfer flavoprotein subunit beta/FixA family protein [Chloroflexi bacterium]|nr:electron transfer flavoprotein subunit beta/FixA family protein [Chloroflexota bacterium]